MSFISIYLPLSPSNYKQEKACENVKIDIYKRPFQTSKRAV